MLPAGGGAGQALTLEEESMSNSRGNGKVEVRSPGRRQACLAVAALGAVAAISACGSSGSANSARADAGTVSIGTNADPAAFGYDPAALSGGGEVTFFQALYSSLFTTTSAGTVKPELATGYTFTADKTVLTLTLRPGVKFTDGSTLTSTLVKENLDRRSSPLL